MRSTIVMLATLCLSACTSMLPSTTAEISSGFSYIPLDPLPISTSPGNSCEGEVGGYRALLDSLPDNAVRVAITDVTNKNDFTFGQNTIGTAGSSYQIILDYVNSDTSNLRFALKRENIFNAEYKESLIINPARSPAERESIRNATVVNATRIEDGSTAPSVGDTIVIPVYVGVGLRLTASVTVLKGSVNLSSLASIAAAVEARRASGSLVVQTLGVTGKQVATSLPLPSELNTTTIQNAVQSLGSIKAILYSSSGNDIVVTPRVTGIYNPLGTGDAQVINAIVSQIASKPVRWFRPCQESQGNVK